ncbi:MAG: hypothetical protein JNM31_06215 [Flavobacteriales bacterium]|nr:hypothetical protein [Flavobacteriales bacterium]
MQRILYASLFVLANSFSFAQKGVYEDLLVLYVDEKYEKCLAKAEDYTLKEATKKDPLPYLYMSMCLFEMSKKEQYQTDYPKASRDALKWAEKYRKKDKNREFFDNYEDFWAALNTMAQDQGENLFDEGAFSKAKPFFDSMSSYYPENPGAWLMLALCQYKTNLQKEGDMSVKEFRKAYLAIPDISRLPADQRKLLKNALIRYSEHLGAKGQRDSARATIRLGAGHFDGEADFKNALDDLR